MENIDEKIQKEREKLIRLLKNVPKSKLKLIEHLIENASIMPFRLQQLQKYMDEPLLDTSTRINSRENPSYKMFNSLLKSYMAVIDQLINCIPNMPEKEKENELQKFLGSP